VDVNAFPGYDGVVDFSERLAEFVRFQLDQKMLDRLPVRKSGTSDANYNEDENLVNGHSESTTKGDEHSSSPRLISQSSISS